MDIEQAVKQAVEEYVDNIKYEDIKKIVFKQLDELAEKAIRNIEGSGGKHISADILQMCRESITKYLEKINVDGLIKKHQKKINDAYRGDLDRLFNNQYRRSARQMIECHYTAILNQSFERVTNANSD